MKEKELSRLGLVLGGDSWEYPLWQLLKDTKKLRIEHIDVKNKTSQAKGQAVFRDFLPEAIMTSKWELAEKDSYTFDGKNYHSVYQRENINLFVTE